MLVMHINPFNQNQLPDNTYLCLTTTYQSDFASLQELFNNQSSPRFYPFRGIPDLVFTIRRTSSTSASSAVHVVEDEYEFIELNHGGRLSLPREHPVNLPGAAAQVIGELYVLATAKILKGVINDDKVTKKFKCKGVLVKRKDQMTLYTLKMLMLQVSTRLHFLLAIKICI